MRRALALAATSAALLLTGCSGTDTGELETAKGSPLAEDEKTEDEKDLTAKNGEDYDACSDGTCEVKVTKKATIPLKEKTFGAEELKITVADGTVEASISYGNSGYAQVSLGGQGVASLNGLLITAHEIDEDVAVLRMVYQD